MQNASLSAAENETKKKIWHQSFPVSGAVTGRKTKFLYIYYLTVSVYALNVLKQGEDNCLEGLTFVVTGVLESVDRDDTKSLIERHGGKVTGNVSRNTSYVVVGRDAGETKLAKVIVSQCL